MLAKTLTFSIDVRSYQVVIAELPDEMNPATLADYLYQREVHSVNTADLVVIRPTTYTQRFENDLFERFNPILERIPNTPVRILTSNEFKHIISDNIHHKVEDGTKSIQKDVLLKAIREAELTDIAATSAAVFCADGPMVFRAPSKEYCSRFLRVGNIQKNAFTLNKVFFWLIPYLNQCKAIIIDTWSISSLALYSAKSLSDYNTIQAVPQDVESRVSFRQWLALIYSFLRRCVGAASESPDKPLELVERSCRVEMLSQYLDGSFDAEEALALILKRLSNIDRGVILVIFSVCMTGSAIKRMKQYIEKHYGNKQVQFRFVSIYSLDDSLQIESLCRIQSSDTHNFKHFPDLGEGAKDYRIIDIDPTTYFPIASNSEKLVDIAASDAKTAKEFFKKYHGEHFFSVHRNSNLGTKKYRHHAIYPDIERMLKNRTFQNVIENIINSYTPAPRLILTPPHDAGRAFAVFVKNMLSKRSHEVNEYAHLNLVLTGNAGDKKLLEELKAVGEQDSIMVLDDVFVTGSRLARYSRSFRDIGFKGRVHYLVGLARPQNENVWKKSEKELRYRDGHKDKNTLKCAEFLLLPDWDEKECPWCKEQAIYRKMLMPGDIYSENLIARMRSLSEPNHLDENAQIFLQQGGIWRVGPNSIFVPEGDSDINVFVSIASVMQTLRNEKDVNRSLDAASWLVQNRLNVENYLGNGFGDLPLRAAILRAALRPELESVNAENEAKRVALAKKLIMDESADTHGVSLELALASSLWKLPVLTFNPGETSQLQSTGRLRDLMAFTALRDR